MLSVNQMSVYHTVMKADSLTNKTTSEQLQKKLKMHEGKYSANNKMYVLEKPRIKCTGFSYLDQNCTM